MMGKFSKTLFHSFFQSRRERLQGGEWSLSSNSAGGAAQLHFSLRSHLWSWTPGQLRPGPPQAAHHQDSQVVHQLQPGLVVRAPASMGARKLHGDIMSLFLRKCSCRHRMSMMMTCLSGHSVRLGMESSLSMLDCLNLPSGYSLPSTTLEP